MIPLNDAIERAKLSADETGILSQSFYNMLVRQVDDKDVHPLTLALVENGLMVRTGSLTMKSIEAQRKALYEDEGEDTYWDEEGQEEPTEIPSEGTDEVSDLREILESAGISISPDGMVSFYQVNIPGIYKERLPQSLPLETAINLWEQKLEIVDIEKNRIKNIQDSLSRLHSQVEERVKTNKSPKISEIEASLSELEGYGFDPRSRSEVTQGISKTIEIVFENIMSSNWLGAVPAIDDAQNYLEEYINNQTAGYENDLYIWDALDRLFSMQKSDPEAFKESIGGLGGLAARLYIAFIRKSQEQRMTLLLDFNLEDFWNFAENLVREYNITEPISDFAESLVDDDYEWMKDVIPKLLEELPSDIWDINIQFTNTDNYGIVEDEYGREISELDPEKVDEFYEIIKSYIRNMVEKDVSRDYIETRS